MASDRDLFANFERMRREMDELFGDVFGGGLAFVGHRVFQKNKPGVVHYPVWGTIGNWVMTKDVLLGKIRW